MRNYITARKSSCLLYVEYRQTFSNNIFAYNTRISPGPDIEIRIDLNPNLRGRSKETNTYIDTRDLANGCIRKLKLIQIDETQIIDKMRSILKALPEPPTTWSLLLELEQEWRFDVKPELKHVNDYQALCLHVIRLLEGDI